MSLIANLVTTLLASGCNAEQVAAAVRVVEDHEAQKSKAVREKWAEKKRKQRMSSNVPETSGDNGGQPECPRDPSFPLSNGFPPKVYINNISPPSLTIPLSPSFHQFWSAYPRKVGKGAAQKAYAKAIKKAEPDLILARLEAWKGSKGFPEPDYVPHASTWLNGERWLDQLEGEKVVMTETEKQDFLKEHQRRMEELWQSKSSS
jgi:hypothetical protein